MEQILSEQNRLSIVRDYFKVNGLVKHQIDTFNWFVTKGLKTIINKLTGTSASSFLFQERKKLLK